MHYRKLDPKNKANREAWVQLVFDLYQDDPNWVPPLRKNATNVLDEDIHPFYQHSEAAFYVVEKDQKIVGRICVMINNNYIEHNNEQTGFWGYYESIKDQDVSDLLFQAAENWAKKRKLTKLVGPNELIGFGAGGLLVEGFEHHQVIDTPYNPPYYDKMVKKAGHKKYRDTFSGFGARENYQIPERVMRIAERAATRSGFTIRGFKSKKELWQLPPVIGDIHEKAFGEIPGFTPQTEAEIKYFAGQLIDIAIPEQIKLVLKNDQPVGFLISYPDVSEGLKKAKGQLFPFGWWHILQAQKDTEWIIFNGVGILPEHQGRGANALLYAELVKTVLANPNYNFAESVHIGEENSNSLADQETMGVEWYKRYRVYQKSLV